MSGHPWRAAVLSVLCPGLGQVYNRQITKAVLCFVGYIVPLTVSSRIGPMLWEAVRQGRELAAGSPPFWALFWTRGAAIAIGLAVLVYSAVDSYRTARRM